MKHMTRKPMLALILLAVMVFGTAFLAFFRADIAAGWEQVDRLYADTRITVELVPEAGWDEIQMKTHKDILIRSLPEVAETRTLLECYYILRDGTPLPEPVQPELQEGVEYVEEYVEWDTSTIRGTNNLPWLTDYWDLTIEWMEGKTVADFHAQDGNAPCLVRRELLESAGLKMGDVIAVSPTAFFGEVHHLAPEIALTIVGTYSEPYGHTGAEDLLVPEESFLNGPKLLWNSDLMYRCYYRAYSMELDPAYNREYDRVETELEKFLYDMGAFSFATNARAIENAARPLIQKLQMQELLVLPLCALLLAAAVVAAVLLGLGMDTEVFLRLMWGEKRTKVFLTLSGVVVLWLAICTAASVGAAFVTAGAGWLTWAAKYSAATALACLCGCAVPLLRSCGRNLVRSYQSREVE